ncbi:E3 ubiquitin-protein ligase HAKAI homolog [Lycium ferocissimum]|uniref:E3 ubiquitin-protein ligase HAKAI homolog n=1 Tax=Lycium ferocissimum TaxID=112874 RepID=UPI00281512A3|nr:E3 ubiquitin-protein ligase HAKAI homolog [Lycium ferocissimum]XP_059305440.1 E3 ubiquitin-protein ligase HAKAI homolog [Lycium ferocissimum]
MLQIRLSKPASENGGGAKSLPPDTVTVACPDHLVLADLPVAKSLGSVNAASLLKTVGRRSRRQLGERVHFCVRCDFPIAIYGRLSPCDHAFCLDCSRSDSLCYLCDERIQKIQTIKLMEGIYICAAPHCLKSFLKKSEFESHIHENHSDLLHQTAEKDGNASESACARKPAASESTVQAPPRPLFSPSSGSQVHDREDKAHHSQTRDQQPPRPVMQPKPPPFTGSIQNHQLEQSDSNPPPGFERPGMQNRLPQQGFDTQVHFPDKQQGIMGGSPFPEYPMQMPQPHGFAVPMNSNPGLAPQFGYNQFAPDGAQPFYSAASTPEMGGSEQGSLLGFPPGAAGNMNFPENYPRQWNMGPAAGQPPPDGFVSGTDPQGRAVFFQGDYGRNNGVMPSNLPPPPSTNRGMEGGLSSNSMDTRDNNKGILMPPQPMSLPPPPPLPHHMSQHQRGGRHYSGDAHDGQGYRWQHEKRDSFGSNQD